MPPLTITAIYAALITGIFLALSLRVIRYRRSHRLGLGDAGDKSLLKRMRAQANCAEYAPIGLILLALIEAQGTPGWVVHIFGLTLLIGRALHAYGFSASPPVMKLRIAGMMLTLFALATMALGLLAHSLF
ncbi:MAPEG family protein [Alphaproteobacteria bacterium KMM 3653]|uniref:MAPEG family protein n=1 Tax=Harenicola maris TaxID=2841044 RepID=A0AAP2CKQ4_9RHOB|nr:MAPEG family protein [Harenicola maris]